MGMTIDKTIDFFNGLECHTPQAKDAKDIAIDTMRKYQKIQEIVTKWQDDPKMKFDTSYYNIAKIIEVVEDGNEA